LTTAGITFWAALLKPTDGRSPPSLTLFSYKVTTPLRAALGSSDGLSVWMTNSIARPTVVAWANRSQNLRMI
jgi:hypothetical protein